MFSECCGFIGSNANETLQNAEEISTKVPYREYEENSHDDWCLSLELTVIESARCDNDVITVLSDEMTLTNENISLIQGLRVIARKSGLYISGNVHEKGAPSCDDQSNSRVYNTHLIFDDNGQIITKYRKIHLFDVSIPSQGINLCESASTAPGTKLVVCESPLGKLGLSTCYDVRFPEMYHELAETGGADILLVPSAFTVPTGKAHWHTLLRARAIENQCYVLAAAQYGEHNEKRKSYGHSIAIDPWGEVMADAGGYDDPFNFLTPKVLFCNIDDDKIKSVRERMPIRNHREKCNFSW